jgi:hypothetical protein
MNSAQITALSIAGAVALYVLSIGPVAAPLTKRYPSVYWRLYYPLRELAYNVPAVQSALDWYVGLWPQPVFPPARFPPAVP